jgi:hypothetical protein
MWRFRPFLALGLLLFAGCQQKPKVDYRALDASGMYSTSLDEAKKLKLTDTEVSQLVKLKEVGASDPLCLSLLHAARDMGREFNNADAAITLSRAGFSDSDILELAKSGQMDILSGDAVTLKLIGLSSNAVRDVLHRHMSGQSTLSSSQISRLKNTGMSEKQILELVDSGMTDDQAEGIIVKREAVRNHSNTDFVRSRGRRSR